MMTTSELQRGIGNAIRRVLRGETIVLTSHGAEVAKLVPVGGPVSHETESHAVGPASGKSRPHARSNGRADRNSAVGNQQDGIGRASRRPRRVDKALPVLKEKI